MRTKTRRNCPYINDLTTSLLYFSSLGRTPIFFLSRYVFLFVSAQINSFYVSSCMCCAMPIIIILTAQQPLTGECWIPPRKDTPHPRAKEKPQQGGRRGKITFRIKTHTHQRCSGGSNKTLCAPGDSTESEPDLPLSV